MVENDNERRDKVPDASADFVRDLATSSPPKGVETVKAASHAVEQAGDSNPAPQGHDAIKTRAYELWEQAGRPDDRHMEFWFQAEREAKTS